ncbi:hypothetical protein TI39_contig4116g00014 [Zymoseptoria brevis]|uniref:Uncharacterized protein n=1 Tax=Zymoseptoria brevis TaxID=1047168 RepID=A0A0F4GDA8_9PEZI|nr:hypothetical protein TI39_contig4116g00014 [Zymoseptoria brevis]
MANACGHDLFLLKEQNAKLLAENRRLIEKNNKIVQDHKELRIKQPAVDSEDYEARIQKLKDKVTALKNEVTTLQSKAGENLLAYASSYHLSGRVDKGSTTVKYYGFDRYGDIGDFTSVSDSDDARRPTQRSYYYDDRDTYQQTRLEEGLFDWLQEWCLLNSDKIERQRMLERKTNLPTVRKLVEDLRDVELEIRQTHENLASQKKKKRQLKRKLIVLADETPVVTTNETMLKRKLFTFCHIMSQPQQELDLAWYPKSVGDTVLSEREIVKIFHQVMTAMRVLHRELVENPKQRDKNFKPRKFNPNQWRILHGQQGTQPDRLVETYVSTMEDARLAATALQNLIYCWKEDML